MKQLFLLPGLLLLLGVISCTEKEKPIIEGTESTPVQVTKEAIVGTYVVQKVESRSGNERVDITQSWFSTYAGDCATDDATIFKPDESFVVLDGTIACDESTDDTGTWKLVSNTRLKIDADTAVIENCTAKTLSIVHPVYSTAEAELIFTYIRK